VTWWSWGWLIIIGAALALEAAALIHKGRGDTFSEHTWALLRKSVLVWFLFAGLMIWLLVHFLGFGLVDGWIRSWG
jgi:hypothetical protein